MYPDACCREWTRATVLDGHDVSDSFVITLPRYTNDSLRSLVVSLVHSRLDYGNFVFVGLLAYLQRRLQTVLNAAYSLGILTSSL